VTNFVLFLPFSTELQHINYDITGFFCILTEKMIIKLASLSTKKVFLYSLIKKQLVILLNENYT